MARRDCLDVVLVSNIQYQVIKLIYGLATIFVCSGAVVWLSQEDSSGHDVLMRTLRGDASRTFLTCVICSTVATAVAQQQLQQALELSSMPTSRTLGSSHLVDLLGSFRTRGKFSRNPLLVCGLKQPRHAPPCVSFRQRNEYQMQPNQNRTRWSGCRRTMLSGHREKRVRTNCSFKMTHVHFMNHFTRNQWLEFVIPARCLSIVCDGRH